MSEPTTTTKLRPIAKDLPYKRAKRIAETLTTIFSQRYFFSIRNDPEEDKRYIVLTDCPEENFPDERAIRFYVWGYQDGIIE